MDVSQGTEIDYQLLIPSQFLNSALSATIRPTQRIRFDSSVNYRRYTASGQETNIGANTYNRLTWQINRPWGIRFVQQSTYITAEDSSHNGSVLFTWLKSPGTEAYIGAIWSIEEEAIQDQTFFAKYTHVFRL